MIITTVSTIKDSLDNFDKFVARNLSSGVDVLFTFLDAPCKEIANKYTGHPNVIVVEAYGDYWKDIDRPKNLNQRQKINANVANSYLSYMASKAWLFHIDGDEQLNIDKNYLFNLSDEISYVRLEPLEYCPNVSYKSKKQLFKRKLLESELQLLYCLKYIEAPSNLKYFNGHLVGKPGIKVDYKKNY